MRVWGVGWWAARVAHVILLTVPHGSVSDGFAAICCVKHGWYSTYEVVARQALCLIISTKSVTTGGDYAFMVQFY